MFEVRSITDISDAIDILGLLVLADKLQLYLYRLANYSESRAASSSPATVDVIFRPGPDLSAHLLPYGCPRVVTVFLQG